MSNFKLGMHYDALFQGMDLKEIRDNLEAVAYGVEERSYTKNLTEEEVSEKKDKYSQVGIKLSELEQQKKDALERFKLAEKDPKIEAKELLEAIKYKSEQRYGELFAVDDQKEGMMFYFDTLGVCIDARPLTQKEKQLKLKTVNENE